MAVIFNVAGTLPKIKRPKKKIGSAKKKNLTLYRTKGLDSKGREFYNTSRTLFGEIYYFDVKDNLYKLKIDDDGNERGKQIRKRLYNIKLRNLK